MNSMEMRLIPPYKMGEKPYWHAKGLMGNLKSLSLRDSQKLARKSY
jgi:hypothetical protein